LVAATEAGAAVPANRVDFVDEDDTRSVLLTLIEEIAYTAGPDADEHLDEVAAGHAEERYAGLAGDRPAQQRLAGTRCSDQQSPLGDASAEALEFFRRAQEIDDLLELEFRFFATRNVFERHFGLVHVEHLGAALTETERLVTATLHLAQEEDPQPEDQ
jgi:hypothetical protein